MGKEAVFLGKNKDKRRGGARRLWKRALAAATLLASLGIASGVHAVEIEALQERMPVDTQGAEKTLVCAKFDNGQRLYLTCDFGEEIWYKLEDVNFDGFEDFVTFPVMGARNIFAEFYVYQPETDQYTYAPVWNGQLCNYELDAEKQCVISQVCDGIRDRDMWVYRWKEGHLEPLRRMRVAEYEEFAYTDSGYTITHDSGRYEITIYDYTQDANGTMIYAQIYPEDKEGEADGERLAAAREALFAGI